MENSNGSFGLPPDCIDCVFNELSGCQEPCNDCIGSVSRPHFLAAVKAPIEYESYQECCEETIEEETAADTNCCVPPNPHYQTAIQPIEFMQANMSPEAFKGGLRFNIIKYTTRIGKKDDELKEARKIADYSRWLVLAVQGKIINPRKD